MPLPNASRLPELGPHGEGWVVLQLLLGAAIAGSGFVGVYWPGSVESFLAVLGLLIAVVGALLVVCGLLSLGSSFTPLPRPRARTRLRQGGIFRLVRHPVYGGPILIQPIGQQLLVSFPPKLSLPLTRGGGVGGRSLRLMRLRVSNPALIPDLLEFLRSRLDVVAEEVSDDEVEVSLVGSYNSDALRMELYLRVRAWEAGRRSAGVEVELVD